jgi:integrase
VQRGKGGKWKGDQGGRQVRWVIGQYPHVQPDDARAMAIAQLSKIGDAETAADLMTPKQRVHSALQESVRTAVQAPKLGECIDTYIKLNRKPGRYWAELKSTFDRDIVPVLGKDTIVADITDAEFQHLLDTKRAKHPGAARNLYAMGLRPFFKWCVRRKIIATSPAEKIDAPKNVEKRDRVLSEAEIKFFWLATDSLAKPYGAFHRVLLLTAQRREEVAGMKWSELNTNATTWTIPKERTKNGKEHLIHLSPQALACLPAKGDSPFVFPSQGGQTSISGYSKAKFKLDEATKFAKPWRVHDLRRTAASGMAALGLQPHIIERVPNHVSGAQGGLVGVYQRYEYLEDRKRALHAWGSHVEALVTEKPAIQNVVPLRA